ncbi:MAG: V-type ATPase subunit [Clostridia bacterium]
MALDLSRRVAGRKNYSYANARVRAMRGNLLTDQEYRKLAKMELSEIAEFIGNRGYGTEIEELGGELGERFRFARVTGPSAKHDEQQVGRDHELADEDVLRIVVSR